VGYFRTWYGNFLVTKNLLVTPTDYNPFCITGPVDSRLPGGGGGQICGLYDLNPAAFGPVRNLVTDASHYGKQTEVYNGFDVGVSGRFGRGGQFTGGLSTGRTDFNSCFVLDSPQLRQCRVTLPFAGQTQVKLNGSYPLPWDFLVSAVYQNLPGASLQANYVATNSQIASSLGRNLGSCGVSGQCNATVSIPLLDPNTLLDDRMTQLDFRLTKVWRLRSSRRVQAMVDLYNVFNGSTVLATFTTFGPSWLRPTAIQDGRLLKFGAQLDF
jgi:hypothetical protein